MGQLPQTATTAAATAFAGPTWGHAALYQTPGSVADDGRAAVTVEAAVRLASVAEQSVSWLRRGYAQVAGSTVWHVPPPPIERQWGRQAVMGMVRGGTDAYFT